MNRNYSLSFLLLIVAATVATFFAWPHLPPTITTHWNMDNEPNGFSPRWSLFLFGPGLLSVIYAVTRLLPWLSPKHFEVDRSRSTYLKIMLLIQCLVAYCYAIILLAGLGRVPDSGRAIMGGVCLGFALLGLLLDKVPRNFYIGIRTPWTLAHERVWVDTHHMAAVAIPAGGASGLVFTALGLHGGLAISALITGALVPCVYSLVHYKQLERRGEL